MRQERVKSNAHCNCGYSFCYTCGQRNRTGAETLEQIHHGQQHERRYAEPLSEAEIGILVQAGVTHLAENPDHNVKVVVYEKSDDPRDGITTLDSPQLPRNKRSTRRAKRTAKKRALKRRRR